MQTAENAHSAASAIGLALLKELITSQQSVEVFSKDFHNIPTSSITSDKRHIGNNN